MSRKPTPPAPDTEACKTCRFFVENDGDSFGFCRRNPPVYIPDPDDEGWTFPVTVTTDWCGQYARKVH